MKNKIKSQNVIYILTFLFTNKYLYLYYNLKYIKMKLNKSKKFGNGEVFCLETDDGMLIETTDTFLPFYTKDAVGRKQNMLDSYDLGDRKERWMVGVSVSSGCKYHCRFCSTGQMKNYRALSASEIVEQVDFVVSKNPNYNPLDSKEFKINYTRMGDLALNMDNIKEAILILNEKYPNIHHFVSTIGIKGMDLSWIKDNITLQLSLHSFDEKHRDWLIPPVNKMTIKELGEVRTNSNLKTTINLTLLEESDFKIEELKKYFDPKYFFIKISPVNENEISKSNNIGKGIVRGNNLI